MHWIVIPFRGPNGAKSRLADVLDEQQRCVTSMAMFQHVLGIASAAVGPGRVLVVTTSSKATEAAQKCGATCLQEQAGSLNPTLRNARAALLLFGATRVTVLAADLPDITEADVKSVLSAEPGQIAVAPDRHGLGTNALTLPLGVDFAFAFGPGSFSAHSNEAARHGLGIVRLDRPGLANDLDTAEDIALLADGHWLHAVIAQPRAA